MPCLVWDSPQGRRVYDLNRAMLVVGRDDVADLQIAEKSVSRRHALVQVENGTVRVTDLGSSSGTRINGARLTPDLPSSLEAGDFVQLGRVTMTFHTQPPPTQKRPRQTAARPKPRPAAAPARPAAAPPTGRWRVIALVLAFVVVAALGALIAVIATRDDSEPQPPPAVVEKPSEEPATKPDATPPAKKEEPDERESPEPPPPEQEAPKQEPGETKIFAPAGAMPPQGFFDPAEYPDLIEFEYTTYYPVRLVTWDGARVEVVGGDGRTYRIPQSKVTKGENRADLARRAEVARLGLDPADADAHLELARWCAKRFLGAETRALAQRVLTLRPGDEEATRLLRSTE